MPCGAVDSPAPLASIGITRMLEIPPDLTPNQPDAMTGFGLVGVKPYFWLIDHGTVGTNMHLAFTVDSRAEVDTFCRCRPGGGSDPG